MGAPEIADNRRMKQDPKTPFAKNDVKKSDGNFGGCTVTKSSDSAKSTALHLDLVEAMKLREALDLAVKDLWSASQSTTQGKSLRATLTVFKAKDPMRITVTRQRPKS